VVENRELPSQKQLIVNADDFGLHPSINSAIRQAHLNGIVTSTSLMPGPHIAPAFENAVIMMSEMPNLDVGLHFTLVGTPGLPDDYVAFLQSKMLGEFKSSVIEDMLRRQLDILLEKGVKVTHIDSHQHLHSLPSIMKIVATVASEYKIPGVRMPAEQGNYAGAPQKRILLSKMLALLSMRSKIELDRAGIKYPDHFAGMAVSGHLTKRRLLSMLNGLQPGVTEIVCHPGTDNLALGGQFFWGYDWQSEFEAVTDTNVAQYIRGQQIEPTTYANLT
jgi:predicted glycoside hydrolase/deacetylase ChbG (UPF0249 family)